MKLSKRKYAPPDEPEYAQALREEAEHAINRTLGGRWHLRYCSMDTPEEVPESSIYFEVIRISDTKVVVGKVIPEPI